MVALAGGRFTPDLRGPAADEAGALADGAERARRPAGSRDPATVVVVKGESLLGVRGLETLAAEPLAHTGTEPRGWIWSASAAEVGRALIDAELRIEVPGVDWPRCGYGGTQADPGGCIGVRLPGRLRCLTHVAAVERAEYLHALRPGAEVDLRGTTLGDDLLGHLLLALREPGVGQVRVGRARFDRARFTGDWATPGGEFEGAASFDRAVFEGGAGFDAVHFKESASFGRADFRRGATFDSAVFDGEARFVRADFDGNATFTDAEFARGLDLTMAELWAGARMSGMRVRGAAEFAHAVFRGRSKLRRTVFQGPVSFASTVWGADLRFEEVRFQGPVTFDRATFAALTAFFDTVFADRATFAGADFAGSGDFVNVTFADPAALPEAWRPLLPPTGSATFRLGGRDGGSGARRP